MRFGINVLNFGPGAGPDVIRGWGRFAEEMGFHFLMISDHVAVTRDVQAQFPAPFYDPFVALGWLAALTERIAIGTTVTILPYRHPLLTARMAANVDQFSGGRFILGVGVGWAQEEFEVLKVPFGERGRLANEYLEIIRLCWAKDTVSYKGRTISFEGVQTGPRPLRTPPIWVGGRSEGALRRAVRYGEAWHPYNVSIAWLRDEGVPRLKRIADGEGKRAPALCPRITLRPTAAPVTDGERKAGHGSMGQIRADLEALAEMGTTHVLLDTYRGHPEQTLDPEADWEMLASFAARVLDLENETLR